MRAVLDESVLIVVDLQPNFLQTVPHAAQVVERAKFLAECAGILGVPTVATTQVADRMGGNDPELHALVHGPTFDKKSFSCCGADGFMEHLEPFGRSQAVIVGVETPVCITQTALDLLEEDWDVIVVSDAVAGRFQADHDAALSRLRHAGAVVAPADSIVYEWMETADHPSFRDVLAVVKKYAQTRTDA